MPISSTAEVRLRASRSTPCEEEEGGGGDRRPQAVEWRGGGREDLLMSPQLI